MTIAFDPERHILLREWADERRIRFDTVLDKVGRAGVEIFYVESPYAGRLQADGESYWVEQHAVDRTIDGVMTAAVDNVLTAVEQDEANRYDFQQPIDVAWLPGRPDDVHVGASAFHQHNPAAWDWRVDDDSRLPFYIMQPPVQVPGATASPAMVIFGRTLRVWAHRWADFASRPQEINGVSVEFTYVCGLSETPGTERNTGVYDCELNEEQYRRIIGRPDAPWPAARRADALVEWVASGPPMACVDVTTAWVKRGDFYHAYSDNHLPAAFDRPGGRDPLILAPGNRVKAWGSDLAHTRFYMHGHLVGLRPIRDHFEGQIPHEMWDDILRDRRPAQATNIGLRPAGPPPRPLSTVVADYDYEYSADEVRAAWTEFISTRSRADGGALKAELLTTDRAYYVLPETVWRRILADPSVDTRVYVSERYECDDFVWSFKADVVRRFGINGAGLVLSHAGQKPLVVVLVAEPDNDEKPGFGFIEPHGDEWSFVGARSQTAIDQVLVVL